ncbi:MAG: 2-dehydropantoate 2-reductase, partial [Oscillibacter sp.]|nr:2-dehydropantoate 2-reductase [Oscillibacter sp.]
RKSEVDLFAGTIRRLGQKHSIPTPANDWLYEQVRRIEAEY